MEMERVRVRGDGSFTWIGPMRWEIGGEWMRRILDRFRVRGYFEMDLDLLTLMSGVAVITGLVVRRQMRLY